MFGRFRDVAVAVFATTLAAAPLAAQNGGYLRSDNLAYLGSVTCYSNSFFLSVHVSDCGTSGPVQRDLGVSFVDGNFMFSPIAPNQAIFLTNTYSNVGKNPSNTNLGKLQMYDFNGSSVQDMSMNWDDTHTIFTLAANGGNTQNGCLGGGDCSLLWNTNGGANGGSFISWSINAIFTGMTEATFNDATGMFESASDPVDITGTLSGLFQDATTGRYYQLNAQLNADSWAVANGFATGTTAGGFAPVTATPEPASIALMATGLIAIGGVSYRRRRRQNA